MKRKETLRKTIERKNNIIEGLSSLAIKLAEKMAALEKTVLDLKRNLEAQQEINDVNLGSLENERRENARLRKLLNAALDENIALKGISIIDEGIRTAPLPLISEGGV